MCFQTHTIRCHIEWRQGNKAPGRSAGPKMRRWVLPALPQWVLPCISSRRRSCIPTFPVKDRVKATSHVVAALDGLGEWYLGFSHALGAWLPGHAKPWHLESCSRTEQDLDRVSLSPSRSLHYIKAQPIPPIADTKAPDASCLSVGAVREPKLRGQREP